VERPKERRKEPRIAFDTPVTVTLLDPREPPPIEGRVVDMSGSGLRLSVPLPIPSGIPVQVEGADMLLLGESLRCQPDGERYQIGISLSHSLRELNALKRWNRTLVGEGEEQAAALQPVTTESA
jgi:PilZ domain